MWVQVTECSTVRHLRGTIQSLIDRIFKAAQATTGSSILKKSVIQTCLKEQSCLNSKKGEALKRTFLVPSLLDTQRMFDPYRQPCPKDRALIRKWGYSSINLLAPELFFLILAHPVYKMWIIQGPNKLELWNKLHFKEKKNGECTPCLKYSVPIFVE